MTTGDEFGLKEGESVVVAASGAFGAGGGKSSADDGELAKGQVQRRLTHDPPLQGPMDLENYDPLADL